MSLHQPTFIFRQLFDQVSGTFTYLLADSTSREAVLIDPVYEQYERDLSLVRELELELVATIETHCHADHVTSAWLLKQLTGSAIIAAADSGIEALDLALEEGDRVEFGERHLRVVSTPGHTDGCISLVLDDETMVFTGDALLIRGCGRTDFQQGSARRLFKSIHDKLFSLPDTCMVYPAHDYTGRNASSIDEEKRLNPRIGGAANEADFVGFMENMQLPHPKKLEIAVPANLKGGRPENGRLPEQPAWAPLTRTYSGVLEIQPQWVASHPGDFTVLDVRTKTETGEERIKVADALLIPVNELRARLDEVPHNKPVVTICRSGKRSVLAAGILKDHGWTEVANVKGGLLQWQAEGLPISST